MSPDPITQADIGTWAFAAWAVVLPAAAYWVVQAFNRAFDTIISFMARLIILETEYKAVIERLRLLESKD